MNAKELLEVRFRSERMEGYERTECALVNCVKLVIKIVENHVVSVKKLVEAHGNELYDRMVEFNLRFNAFRYSLIGLEVRLVVCRKVLGFCLNISRMHVMLSCLGMRLTPSSHFGGCS